MKYRVTYDGVTKTYAMLWSTASHLLDTAKEQERHEGSLLNLRAAVVFYTFTFEAYLNHVGAEEIEIWDEIERISHSKKLRILERHLRLTLDRSQPPFKIIEEMFQLRDTLAHGRTRTIDPIHHTYETETEPLPLSAWRIHEWETLTPEKVDRYAASIKDAIEIINGARLHPDLDVRNQGIRGRTVETIQ